jgi:ATP-dependent DNA helicase RecG
MHYDYKEIANGFLVELGYEHQKTSNKSEKVVENVTGNVTGNVTENVTEKRIKKIIEVLAANNKTTTEQLANKLKVNKRTIIRDIEKLKKLNKIKYVGPAKGGYWQIIKNSNN